MFHSSRRIYFSLYVLLRNNDLALGHGQFNNVFYGNRRGWLLTPVETELVNAGHIANGMTLLSVQPNPCTFRSEKTSQLLLHQLTLSVIHKAVMRAGARSLISFKEG